MVGYLFVLILALSLVLLCQADWTRFNLRMLFLYDLLISLLVYHVFAEMVGTDFWNWGAA